MKILKGTVLSLAAVAFLLSSASAMAVSNLQTNQADVKWDSDSAATYYNVYFKEANAVKWEHAVRRLPKTSTAITISYLKRGVAYKYDVSALNSAGKEIWWSGEKLMKVSAMK